MVGLTVVDFLLLQKLIVEGEAEVLLIADEVELVWIEVRVQAAVRYVCDTLSLVELAISRTGFLIDLTLIFEHPAALFRQQNLERDVGLFGLETSG